MCPPRRPPPPSCKASQPGSTKGAVPIHLFLSLPPPSVPVRCPDPFLPLQTWSQLLCCCRPSWEPVWSGLGNWVSHWVNPPRDASLCVSRCPPRVGLNFKHHFFFFFFWLLAWKKKLRPINSRHSVRWESEYLFNIFIIIIFIGPHCLSHRNLLPVLSLAQKPFCKAMSPPALCPWKSEW